MRLYFLQYGLNRASGTPIPGYLIETNAGQRILIDTGFPTRAIGSEVFPGFVMTADDHVTHQLGMIGLTPADIDTLICTHFDFDHAGAHDLFTSSELIIQRAQWESAHDGSTTRYDEYRPYWDHPALRYRQIDGDTTLVPGVELIDTSGHAPGHQSILVRLPKTGPVLLTIDAAPTLTQFDPTTYQPNQYDADPAGALASLQKLKGIMSRERVTLTVCGHDSIGWAKIRKAPEWYE